MTESADGEPTLRTPGHRSVSVGHACWPGVGRYADAIPLDVLKNEQDRIRTSLQGIEAKAQALLKT